MCRLYLWTAVALLTVPLPGYAADLSKIDRTIGKEPTYESQPKYCLVVVGPEAKTRVWLVLDGDVLYVDRNGDGDLTGTGKRIPKKSRGEAYSLCVFPVGTISPHDGSDPFSLDMEEEWFDEAKIISHAISYQPLKGKGFAQKTVGVLTFADRPQDAPIIHFGGPLTLTIFNWHKPLQPRQFVRSDRNEEYSLIVATSVFGTKHEVFAMIDGYFPDLAGDGKFPTVAVEFPGKEAGDKGIVPMPGLRYCACRRRFWFRVQVPAEAGQGKARVTLSFPDWKEAAIAPATFEVPIVDSPARDR
jgi:hypothetical protein